MANLELLLPHPGHPPRRLTNDSNECRTSGVDFRVNLLMHTVTTVKLSSSYRLGKAAKMKCTSCGLLLCFPAAAASEADDFGSLQDDDEGPDRIEPEEHIGLRFAHNLICPAFVIYARLVDEEDHQHDNGSDAEQNTQ